MIRKVVISTDIISIIKMSICDELFVMKITICDENKLIFIRNNHFDRK